MNFNILELQHHIEEKRLALGKKLETFLLKNLKKLSEVFNYFLNKKSSAFFGSLLIVAISIFLQSIKDISPHSSYVLSASNLDNKFVINELSLAIIPNFLSNTFNISSIIAAFIFYNLLGIFSLFTSYKILQQSEIRNNYAILNLIIFAFGFAIFLPLLTLSFNQIINSSNYFIALATPYIAYHLIDNSSIKNRNHIFIGLIAGLLIAIDWSFAILVITFEIRKIFINKSLNSFFHFRNYLTILLAITFFNLDFSWLAPSIRNIFTLVKYDLFPVFLLMFLCSFLVKKFRFLEFLFLAVTASALIVLTKSNIEAEQRNILYSISLPMLFTTIYLISKNNFIDFKNDFIFLLIILLIPSFNHQDIFAIALDLPVFWWFFILILRSHNLERLGKLENTATVIRKNYLTKLFLPNDLPSWILFIISASISLYIIIFAKDLTNLLWIVSVIIFINFIKFTQNLYEKSYQTYKFSRLYLASILLVLSYFISLYCQSFFIKESSFNYINDQIAKNVKTYDKNNENILFITNNAELIYPIFNYLKIDSTLLNKDSILNSQAKNNIKNLENKLIFIDNNSSTKCDIGFLEMTLKNEELKKIFLQNYRFLNRIIETENLIKKTSFFHDSKEFIEIKNSQFIKNDIEIYIKK